MELQQGEGKEYEQMIAENMILRLSVALMRLTPEKNVETRTLLN
jgi:hypothetical protein